MLRENFTHALNLNRFSFMKKAMSLNRKISRRRENAKLASLAENPRNIRAAIDQMREGLVLHEQRRIEAALVRYQSALTHHPRFAEAYHAKGIALRDLGKFEAALESLGTAVILKPDHVNAHLNTGEIHYSLGRYGEAAKFLQNAIRLDPDNIEAYNRLGQCLHKQFLFPQAVRAYEAALRIDPDADGVCHNLALAKTMLGDRTGAAPLLQKAIEQAPGSLLTLSYLVANKMHLCDWENIEKQSHEIVAAVMEKRGICDPFIFQSLPSAPGNREQFFCARANATISEKLRRSAAPESVRKFIHAPPRGEKIRIGYVSMDFRSHPMAYLMMDVLKKHDRRRFEVYAYSYGPPDDSPERRQFMESVDRFVEVQNLTDGEAAERIHEDGIHILIDRKGYTYGARLGIFAARPAPIQVNYLAYGGTMGADYIDYIVLDEYVVPPDQQPFYTERLVYLPDTYQPNSLRPVAEHTPSRADCGLPGTGIVFCCFNQTYKITPGVFDVWMRILDRVPESVLWLLKPEEETANNLRREAAKRGMNPERLGFAPKLPQAEHLARHRHADLFLDTLVVNALTTASDALLMDCPVITCPGQTFVARGAGSILRALEMPELITGNLQEYENLAVSLARSPERLRKLREKIAHKRKIAPLFDSTSYTRHLDAAYLEMWRRHQTGEGPKTFQSK